MWGLGVRGSPGLGHPRRLGERGAAPGARLRSRRSRLGRAAASPLAAKPRRRRAGSAPCRRPAPLHAGTAQLSARGEGQSLDAAPRAPTRRDGPAASSLSSSWASSPVYRSSHARKAATAPPPGPAGRTGAPPRLPQRPGRPRPRPSACSLRPRHAALPDGYRVPSGGAAPGNRVGRETTRPAGRSGQGASRRIAVSGHACVSGPAGLLPPLPRLLPTQGRCARRGLVPPRRACGAGGEALPLPADLPIRPWLQRRFIRKPLRAPEPLTPHPVPSLRAPAPRQLCSWGGAGLCTAGPRKLPGGGGGR